jgi:hypothetical protein
VTAPCADLANASKHLTLDPNRKPRTGDRFTTIARNDATALAGTGTSAHRFYIESNGTEYDVLKTAEKAVEEWRRFLSERHLT